MSVPPATIKLFLPFGDPTRLRTAELSNWSGKALAAPRSDLAELFSRDEADQAGVYVLAGTDGQTGQTVAYVGEAEVLRHRLKRHVQEGLDYWNRVVVFVSKDENMTKAHVRYLEGAMIDAALDADRATLKNAQGSGGKLPESDRADMDVYLSKVRQLLPVLGSDLLTPKPTLTTSRPADVFTARVRKLTATGAPSASGFVVFEGSQAVLTERKSAPEYAVVQRRQLRDSGVLTEASGHLVFTEDVEFTSPSAAASAVKGGSENGRTAWVNPAGVSLKQLDAEQSTDAL